MNKIGLAVHGGAAHSADYSKKFLLESQAGLTKALKEGYKVLKRGGSALRAVEEAVIVLEDDPHFNAGRGSALNCDGEVEMDASIMDGRTLKAGAVSMVRNVKNPIILSRIAMTKTKHVMFSGYGALELAKLREITIEPDSYFMTDKQLALFKKLATPRELQKAQEKKAHGTVGAVAIDKRGNLAAATSTGGTNHSLPGRIGDSCIIGSGCYANNKTCAVSGTGQGEFLITGVVAHTIAMFIELKGMTLHQACKYVINQRIRKGDMGVIAIDKKANISFAFNTRIMRRGSIDADGNIFVAIY